MTMNPIQRCSPGIDVLWQDGARHLRLDDAMKLRSSMTLFARAAPEDTLFSEVLDRYFGGVADEATDARLAPPLA